MGTGRTCRCSICSINWPFYPSFKVCPICDQECKFLMIEDPREVLTLEEAARACEEAGVKVPTAAMTYAAKKPKAKRIAINVEQHVAKLHDEMDEWAQSRPSWMK